MFGRLFLDHPATVNESYFQHLIFALRFSSLLFAAGGAAFVHAFVPCLFEKTAGLMICRMHRMIETRH
ncbi:MAG: DUF6356 family protein [Pseudomonadota bacterium]